MAALSLTQHVVIGDQLALAWSDGQESYLPLQDLRKSCPCANCQGEPDAMGRVFKPKVIHIARSYQVKQMQQVGGYALQITWVDGHNSGIYPFDLLRRLGA